MGAWGFVWAAYGIVWTVILVYWLGLKRRYKQAERELARLKATEATSDHDEK